MTRGTVGTRNLNWVLRRQVLNPPALDKAEISRGGLILRVGDCVIQKVNDYNREIFDGDLGTMSGVDLEEQGISVLFDERQVVYGRAI